jgi:hypothetical protein
MGSTRLRRPPAPSAAERARSAAARGGTASLVGSGAAPAAPLVHVVRADGSALLLLADDEPVLGRARTGGAAMLEVADRAPVELREPVRGLLWLTGRLRALDGAEARSAAMQAAEAHPHPELLRLGHGATLVRLDAGSVVLSDAEGTAALTPLQLAAARPDPFCRWESPWLAHLESDHPDVLARLRRHLPGALRDDPRARVRPLGVDRCGLRLRVEAPDRDHDVRLAWTADTTTPDGLRAQLHRLAGCPARVS